MVYGQNAPSCKPLSQTFKACMDAVLFSHTKDMFYRHDSLHSLSFAASAQFFFVFCFVLFLFFVFCFLFFVFCFLFFVFCFLFFVFVLFLLKDPIQYRSD